jgi:hypothetical protein
MPVDFDTYAHRYLNDPDEELFSESKVQRFSQGGEQIFCREFPCIQVRQSLSITASTHTYTLADDIIDIRRISYLGKKLDPLPHRMFREAFQNGSQTGKPFWYVFTNIGQNQVRFFPTPNATIAAASDNLYGSSIDDAVIVDYFAAPDFSTKVVPVYFRRRLLKAATLESCFAVEGEGQNIKNSKYFKGRFTFLKNLYGGLLQDLHNRPRKLVLGASSGSQFFPGQPLLPMSRYGISLDAGE